MTEPDPVMTEIARAIELGQQGERTEARRVFAALWEQVGEQGDALHRCAIAHSMADVHDDVHEELRWDLLALQAADTVTDDRAAQAGIASPVRAFYPSLHLNLAHCCRKLGEADRARDHLARGRAAVDALPDDGYGQLIRGGLESLAEQLESA